MKKNLLLSILFLLPVLVYGQDKQRRLSGAEIPGTYVFSTKKSEALVVISFPGSMQVSFKTNFNEKISIFKREKEDQDSVVYLRFPVGEEWEGRRLSIMVPEFSALTLPLFNMSAKETRKYRIFDPDAQVLGCYYQLTREATALLQKSLYDEAMDKYNQAALCDGLSPEQSVVIAEKIEIIDSIQTLRTVADLNFNTMNYRAAADNYIRVFSFNRDDSYAMQQATLCQQKLYENCNLLISNGNHYFKRKEYQKALDEYGKAIDQSCPDMALANSQIQKINNKLESKKNRDKVFSLEFDVPGIIGDKNSYYAGQPGVNYYKAKGAYLGFSIGNYKIRKSGAYFTTRFNPELFKAIRSKELSAKPELNLSFGWTIKIVKPVWIFFGPGYTGVGQYKFRDLTEDEVEELSDAERIELNKDENLKMNIKHAISPEIGLLGKIGPVALRYTFQYRIAVNKDDKEYIGPMRHVVGVGYCF